MSGNQRVFKVGDKVLVKVTLNSEKVLDELARRIRSDPNPEARLQEVIQILKKKLEAKNKKPQKYLRMRM